MKLFFIWILGMLFCSSNPSTSKEGSILYGVIAEHGKKVEKEKGVRLVGTGGAIPNKIHQFIIRYSSEERLDIGRARKLQVELAEDIIAHVNVHPEWAPYFKNFPINENNLELTVGFRDENSEYLTPPFICFVGLVNGNLGYFQEDPIKKRSSIVHQETYQEALKIVKQSQ